jgi:endoglycosylceramidase
MSALESSSRQGTGPAALSTIAAMRFIIGTPGRDLWRPDRTSGAVRRLRFAIGLAVIVLLTAFSIVLVNTSAQGSGSRSHQFSSAGQIARARSISTKNSPAFVHGVLHAPGGPYLYDSSGRVTTLHGVNAVDKHSPFVLIPSSGRRWTFNRDDARSIASLGFNVVRLGLLWQGIEPGQGGALNDPATCTVGRPTGTTMLNTAVADIYLQRLKKTVDLLGQFHVYTLLDMHQDVYSQAFRGEGAPAWAVCTNNMPIVSLGGRWSTSYSSSTLRIAEDHFWSNDVVGNLQGQYDLAWSMIATYFRHDPWIIGYDPYNEPYSPELMASDNKHFATDLECFYTGRAHPGTLDGDEAPMACPTGDPSVGVVPSIERADPNHLVFIEPDNYSVRRQLPSLLGQMDFPNLVYNFHAYCGSRSLTGDPLNLSSCVGQILKNISTRRAELPAMATSRQPGGPAWFMGEFGASQSVPLLNAVTTLTNGYQLGWAYWSWKYYDDPTGSSHEALAPEGGRFTGAASVLDRPYGEAVAGRPVSSSFSVSTQTFHLDYIPSGRHGAPTLVALSPASEYPNGYCAEVSGGTVVSLPGERTLMVRASRNARRVTVEVNKGSCP